MPSDKSLTDLSLEILKEESKEQDDEDISFTIQEVFRKLNMLQGRVLKQV